MLLDIGIGIFTSLFINDYLSIPLTPGWIGLGVLFSLSPDIDFLILLSSKGMKTIGSKAYEHRNLLHYPLLFIPTGMLIVSFFDGRLPLLFGIITFLHFLHDSIGLGWGIQWFYPFSSNHYMFFYRYQSPKEKMPRRLFYSWHHEDIEKLAERYGDENWIKNIYLKFHPYAIVELLVFLASLLAFFRSL